MVLLTTTPQILDLLSSLPPSAISTLTSTLPTTTTSKTNNDNGHKNTLPTTLSTPIPHRTLVALSRLPASSTNNTPIPPLNTLLRGTHPYKPPPPPKPTPTPEYTALMARLHVEQEERSYAALLAQQHSQKSLPFTHTAEDEDPISPSLVLNILLSVVMCGAAVFQMSKWYANDGVRVLMGLGAGIVVGVAEVGVYSIYLMKLRQGREREARKKERKVFIGEYVPETDERQDGERVVQEKQEIWGKGVNGGVRRRVRVKWEKSQEDRE